MLQGDEMVSSRKKKKIRKIKININTILYKKKKWCRWENNKKIEKLKRNLYTM